MAGLPVTVRLLDPPLHEFLPDRTALAVELALTEPGPERTRLERLAERVRQLSEQNPMLGTRGCRLALLHPGIYAMQVRAIVRGALAAAGRGEAAQIEIMIPLVAYAEELRRMRELVEEVVAEELESAGRELEISIGTMIELPRAALRAGRDRRVRRLLLVRHERPHADDARLLARRRRVGLPRDLPRGRRDRAQSVREHRHRRRRRARAHRSRARSRGAARAQARHLRRARRRPGLGRVLPRRRPRLRLLLALPRADRAPRRRPRRARRHGRTAGERARDRRGAHAGRGARALRRRDRRRHHPRDDDGALRAAPGLRAR